MLVGTLGNDEIRKVSVVGAHCVEAYTLERLGRWACLPIVVSGILRVSGSVHLSRVYDYAVCPSLYQGTPFEVCCLEGLRLQTDAVEWMYQLDDDSSNDPYRDWNSLCEAVSRRRWETAAGLLLDGDFVKVKEHHSEVFAKYERAVREKKSPDILYVGITVQQADAQVEKA
eukprot:Rhum_TRINITY_DN15335_c1_g1::Rhum_TRINITY_DN15335_c1_g1_i1::g.151478::m.151478